MAWLKLSAPRNEGLNLIEMCTFTHVGSHLQDVKSIFCTMWNLRIQQGGLERSIRLLLHYSGEWSNGERCEVAIVLNLVRYLIIEALCNRTPRSSTTCTFRISVREKIATWLILPVVIRSSKRLSHACLSKNNFTVKLRMAHYISYSLFDSTLLLG